MTGDTAGTRPTWARPGAWGRPALALAMFLVALLPVTYRIERTFNVPGHPSTDKSGLVDFRDAIYYPVVAFLDGKNPYDTPAYLAEYPVERGFPLYGPLVLLLYLPLGLLPLVAAEWLYFLISAGLILVLTYLALRFSAVRVSTWSVCAVGAFLVLSETGQWNLCLGQSAAIFAVVIYTALYFASRRPWLSVLALALSTMKPTYAIPLALLMLVRGGGAIVARGFLVGGVLSAIPASLVIRAAGGPRAFLRTLTENYAHFGADPTVQPATSCYRVDTAALIGRLLGVPLGTAVDVALFLIILGVAAVGLRWLNRSEDEAVERLSVSLICVAVLACTYHMTYELLLLTMPLIAAAKSSLGPAARARPWLRQVALGAVLLPMVNFLTDGWTLDRLRMSGSWWLAACSLDGAALLVGLATFLALASGARVSGELPARSPERSSL